MENARVNAKPVQLDVYLTRIPMRSFEHAAASRDVAEALVVRLQLDDGRVGYGETLPRKYVTGETLETVQRDICGVYWPALVSARIDSPGVLGSLPFHDETGRCMNAARCAVELAVLDAAGRSLLDAGSDRTPAARCTGVLGSANPAKTLRRLRLMRLFGLRHFKLKLGLGEDADRDNLRLANKHLAKAIKRGACTLRVDVNGGWDADSTPQRVDQLAAMGVSLVEQPVFCAAGELADLARKCLLPLIADESLLGDDDAAALAAAPDRIVFNIRISKNGGLMAAQKLARFCGDRSMRFILGCMVGETGILSLAQRQLLRMIPQPAFVEGNYGRWLLADDLVRNSPRFGYGGRIGKADPDGWGRRVLESKLEEYGVKTVTLA